VVQRLGWFSHTKERTTNRRDPLSSGQQWQSGIQWTKLPHPVPLPSNRQRHPCDDPRYQASARRAEKQRQNSAAYLKARLGVRDHWLKASMQTTRSQTPRMRGEGDKQGPVADLCGPCRRGSNPQTFADDTISTAMCSVVLSCGHSHYSVGGAEGRIDGLGRQVLHQIAIVGFVRLQCKKIKN
jgi:hypothetical protein